MQTTLKNVVDFKYSANQKLFKTANHFSLLQQ